VMLFFKIGSHKLFALGLVFSQDPPDLCFRVARITGVSHQCPATRVNSDLPLALHHSGEGPLITESGPRAHAHVYLTSFHLCAGGRASLLPTPKQKSIWTVAIHEGRYLLCNPVASITLTSHEP
jgi:hypothetical protein